MATSPADAFRNLDTLGGSGGSGTAPSEDPLLTPPAGGNISNTVASSSPELRDRSAVEKLRPGSDLHTKTLAKLTAMLRYSEDKVKSNFGRFRNQEMKVQAYTQSQDYDALVRTVKESRGSIIPEPVQIIVPYTYATLHAAATFIGTVLIGRRPIFPLSGVRGTNAENARYMESALTTNLDAVRAQEKLWQHIWDTLLYGYSPIFTSWDVKTGKTFKGKGVDGQRVFSDDTIFEGNAITTIDPYKFRPDPRVPMHEVHERGDFCFFLMETSESTLRDGEKSGKFKWTKQALAKAKDAARVRRYDESRRSAFQQTIELSPTNVVGFNELAQGTVRLIPKDWGLGDETESELWHFVWLPDAQIIAAEPYDAVHNQHPFSVGEPTSLGYDFMSMSMAEMISVFQDVLSWLVSSRMENVRASISNSFIVDPSRIEMNDMASSVIGRVIRMKQSAMGLPVREAIEQLIVQDVTGGHFTDIQTMRTLADSATGVTDNLRGLQTQGGRRSATEARMSMQAGASRLSQLAMRLSGQSFHTLANQMISNIQQYVSPAWWVELSGEEGRSNPQSAQQVDIEQLAGSFAYQISDGTLPLDKGALLEVWQQILMGIAQDPELRQNWDLNEIFRYIAMLGGAKNIDSFKRTQPLIAPPGQQPPGTPAGPQVPQMPASLAFAGGR